MRRCLAAFFLLLASLTPEWSLAAITLEEVETAGVGAFRHASYTSEVMTHPDGVHVLSSSRDQCVRLWEIASGKLVRCFTTPGSGDMWGIRFLKDGKEFLAASSSDQVYRFETATGKVLENYPHGGDVFRLAVHPDGKHFVSAGGDDLATLWEIEGAKKIRTFNGHTDDVFTVIIVNDGKEVITGSDDDRLKKWDLESGECLETLAGDPSFDRIYTLARSPDGKRFAMVSDDDSVRVFQCDTLKEVWKTKMRRPGEVVAWSPDGELVASTCKDGRLYLFQATDGDVLRKIEVANSPHTPITFSNDGQLLISGGDRLLHLHRVATGESITPTEGGSQTAGRYAHLAVGPRGEKIYLASASTLIVRDRSEEGGEPRSLDFTESISALALSPDGSLLAVGDSGGSISLLKTSDLASSGKMSTEGRLLALDFHPDGKRLAAVGKNGMVQLWSLPDQKNLRRFKGHRKDVEVVKFSHDGEQLITASEDDHTVRFWSLANGQEVSRVKIPGDEPDSFLALDGGRSFVLGVDDEKVYGRILPELEKKESINAGEVAQLIERLGAREFQVREEAMIALAAYGRPVLPFLEEVRTDDPEVRSRLLGVREVMRGQMADDPPEVIATFEQALGGLAADPRGQFWVGRLGSEGASRLVVGLIDHPDKTIEIIQTLDTQRGCAEPVFSADGTHVGSINADGSYSLFKVTR